VIQTLLEAMLLKIKGCIKITEATETQSSILLRKFLLLLDQHFQKNYTVYEYAKMLHVTTLKLNSACNKILRKTASQLICDKVILESKRLLVSTDWSAKEIAFHLNFNDPAYFNRFFKKHTCLNPGMFRNTTGVNSAIESK
jgi:AraC family transcriptional activator of pobA